MCGFESLNEIMQRLAALRNGCPKAALVYLRKAIECTCGNPFQIPYYGLALARAENDRAEARPQRMGWLCSSQ
jgi:hypothetical protein